MKENNSSLTKTKFLKGEYNSNENIYLSPFFSPFKYWILLL